MNDTIVGISTALGVGAISIIRVSGSEAINIVNMVFKEKNLNNVDTHTIHYGHIFDGDDVIDEVLVSVMVLGAVAFLGYMSLFVAGKNSKRAAN